MNWFLDMCILIFYAEVGGKNYQKSAYFVQEKNNNRFIICSYISKENMPKWIKRQEIILKLAGNKILDSSYDFEKSEGYEKLISQDKIKLMKFISIGSSASDKKKYVEKIRRNQDIMLQRIHYFLQKLIDQEVVSIKEIDFDLRSTLFTFLNNHSDAMTLASGIQHHQKEELIIMTGDKHDWNKNNLEWVYGSRPDLLKKYPNVPEIKYIQNY